MTDNSSDGMDQGGGPTAMGDGVVEDILEDTGAPTRHVIPWQEDSWYDPAAVDTELRRVFDICHGCRRCFNLCDTFPRLFDLIDESESGELDTVASADFKPVVDACTLCDMCFMTKCPYVPPHEFDLDFPHLMLRYRAAERRAGDKGGFVRNQLAKTDRNGKLAALAPGLANWATREDNHAMRNMLHDVAGIHRDAALPEYQAKSFQKLAKIAPSLNPDGPAQGRKAVLYATCFANFNNPAIGQAARAVLAHNGVETEVVYPGCCGMPKLEQGDLAAVAKSADHVAKELLPWIENGYDIVALVPSCALMVKFEWPLILPDNEAVKTLARATRDISEYVVELAKSNGMQPGLKAIEGGVTLHLACHARAQNMGAKGAEMLRLLPDTKVNVIERCAGHGGTWGIMKENFETALKVGRPAARTALKNATDIVVSECPLAGEHLRQGMERLPNAPGKSDGAARGDGQTMPETVAHPIILLARAYGLAV